MLPFSLFRTEYSKLKFVFHFLKAIFDTSFRPKQNAIPVRKWCGYAHAWGIGQASRACKCCWRRTRYKAYPDQPKKSRKTIWPQITAQPINGWRKIFDFPKRISGFPMWMVSIPGQCPVAVLVVLAVMVIFRFRRGFLGNGFQPSEPYQRLRWNFKRSFQKFLISLASMNYRPCFSQSHRFLGKVATKYL